MRKVFVILLCLVALGGGVAATVGLYLSRPKAKIEPTEKVNPLVEVLSVRSEEVEIKLPSQGLIEAKHMTTLAAEVGGKIISISDKFEAGGEFAEGEIMLEIDSADYEANLAQSKSNLEEAKLALDSEQARATQAERDWKSLGNGKQASDLTLRKPQLAGAKAKVAAAEAAVAKAERDLERTKLKAPYAARIERTQADLGAYIGMGNPLASIFSVGPYEVRLPLSLDDFAFVEQAADGQPQADAELSVTAAGKTFTWNSEVVRTEGQIERSSRSVYLVAEVTADKDAATLLQPGLFVEAEVNGITLKSVFRVPLQAFHDLDRVIVVSPDNKLYFREVEVIRREGGDAIVGKGLQNDERLLMTEMGDVVEQMTVRVVELDNDSVKNDGAVTKP